MSLLSLFKQTNLTMKIVTCYYTIPSKFSKEFYYENIKRFFRKLTRQPVIFFTDQENFNYLKDFAKKNIQFVIQPFEKCPVFEDFSEDFWKQQILNDPEDYHTWQLGALWASKSYFVREASKLCNNKWLIWVDAGCIRDEAWDLNDFTKRKKFNHAGVFVQLLNELPNEDFFKYPDVFIAGSHIHFHRNFITEYIEQYKKTVQKYIDRKVPVIMDQYIIATMTKSSEFIFPTLYDANSSCVDKWFFFFDVI
jgi:hypothetical protein